MRDRRAMRDLHEHERIPWPHATGEMWPGLHECWGASIRRIRESGIGLQPGGYEAIREATVSMQRGRVLHVGGLSAGNGLLVDWRTVRSGQEVASGPAALVAIRLAQEVGPVAVLSALLRAERSGGGW